MSIFRNGSSLREKFDTLRSTLSQNIIGQDQAIGTIVSSLERYKAGLHDNKRPIGAFLFLGPTGVGKTYTIEQLAKLVQPDDAFIKIDCSEYTLDHEVAKLLGAPPGYLGHEVGSVLTKYVNGVKNPEGGFILLLDEIEKAHPKFFDMWLQVLDSGSFTDSKGVKLDFGRALIFMTSNVGAAHYSNEQLIGFRKTEDHKNMIRLVSQDLKKTFRPEFLNRLSDTVFFHPLTTEQQSLIFNTLITDLNRRLARYYIRVELEPAFQEIIFQKGFSPLYGARELRRVLIHALEQPLARKIIRDEITPDSLIEVTQGSYEGEIVTQRIGDFPILVQEAV